MIQQFLDNFSISGVGGYVIWFISCKIELLSLDDVLTYIILLIGVIILGYLGEFGKRLYRRTELLIKKKRQAK